MKHLKVCILLFVAVAALSSAGVHKFYVAIFQMDYVAEKKAVHLTARVFTDDLEKAFEKKYGKKFYLATRKEIPETKEYLSRYFKDNVHIKLNGADARLKYLGKEVEDDVLVLYFTLPANQAVTTVEMKNTTLLETYSEQQNMVHAEVNGNKKSILLTYDKPSGVLEF